MGQLRRIIPASVKERLVDAVDNRFPEGTVRNNIANGITVAGGALTVCGFLLDRAGYRKTGTIVGALGLIADDIDGDTAKALGTNSKAGALLDAGVDKAKALAEILKQASHIRSSEINTPVNRPLRVGVVAVKHTANAAINIYSKSRGGNPESNGFGKASMWTDGVMLVAQSTQDTWQGRNMKRVAGAIESVAFCGSVVLGTLSTAAYAAEAFTTKPAKPNTDI